MAIKIYILTEGGVGIGLGHVVRCSAIYAAFEEFKYSPVMIVNGDDSVKKNLVAGKYLLNNWIENLQNQQFLDDAEIVVVDSYLANENIYRYISKKVNFPVFFDDNIRLNYPRGTVVNGAIFAEQMNYPENPEITYLLGNNYSPLRKVFWDVPGKKNSNDILTLLLTMGGSDIRNLTPGIIQFIQKKIPGIAIKVIVGDSFTNIAEIKKYASVNTELVFNANESKMKDIMSEADVAVSSGGQTLYELARMGVPAIAVQTAENQKYSIMGWVKAGFIEYAGGWNDFKLLNNILSCFKKLESVSVRKQKSAIGINFVDGQGARRIVKKLIKN